MPAGMAGSFVLRYAGSFLCQIFPVFRNGKRIHIFPQKDVRPFLSRVKRCDQPGIPYAKNPQHFSFQFLPCPSPFALLHKNVQGILYGTEILFTK